MNARVLARLVLILIGYAAACLTAAAIVQTLYVPGVIPESAGAPSGHDGARSIPDATILFLIWFSPPAATMILIGELTRKSGWRYYALSGLSIGIAIVLAFALNDHLFDAPGDFGADNLVYAMIAGSVAGVVYWAIAGRLAGAWGKPAATT